MFRFKLLLPFVLALLCCNRGKEKHVRSFYYWKTTFDTSGADRQPMQQLGVSRFYVRYADVDINPNTKEPAPVGIVDYHNGAAKLFTANGFIPVVYITNRTFEAITPTGADSLAMNVTQLITRISQYMSGATLPREIQIDCDWTASTRDRYFGFLRKMRRLDSTRLVSATIRLYPYKYHEKMGVPPVDKGMLMCYNMGGITNAATKNSVFDVGELGKYLTVKDYPLPLDVALPVFGWQVWFRGGKYMGIIHKGMEVGQGTAFNPLEGNTYRCAQDTVIGENYFREGDELRMEYPAADDLVKAAGLLNKKVLFSSITFFDWNTQSIQKYEKAIKAVYDSK